MPNAESHGEGAAGTNPAAGRLPLFPVTTALQDGAAGPMLTIGGCDLAALAAGYGTPLYLYDEETLNRNITAYRHALREFYPGPSAITYAGKAYLSLAMAQWTQEQGLWLDCTGVGELHVAGVAGVLRSRILVHGVNKSRHDLAAAVGRAAVIVVDNLTELAQIVELAGAGHEPFPDLWLRMRPGIPVPTHPHIRTGHEESKFGMGMAELVTAATLCQERSLPLTGLHVHLGSQFHDPAPLARALEMALELAEMLRRKVGWLPRVISPGGGWGVAYHEEELPEPAVQSYVAAVGQAVAEGCRVRRMPLPTLQLEPGRSLVARAGVALYRVGAVKATPHRRWVLLDGGLADNPRPALYDARYSALPVARPLRPPVGGAWLAGPYCESGDIVVANLPMPTLIPGDLVAVPVSGAYQLSMGSNYNGACRPAVLWLREGKARLIQRRESVDDLVARDRGLRDRETEK